MSTYAKGYQKRRGQGGMTGLGTGARSSLKGRTVAVQNKQKKKYQQILQTIPNDGRRMRPEVKILDTLLIASKFATTYELNYVNEVREGTGFWNRVGRKICMKSLHLTGYISRTMNNAAAQNEDFARIMVVYDRQANGAVFNFADLIQSVAQDGTTLGSTAVDHINMNNRERFIVLMDKRIMTPPVGIAGISASGLNVVTDSNNNGNDGGMKVTRFIKLQDLETHFLSNSVPITIADITTGALAVVTIGEVAAPGGTGPAWQFRWSCRLKFYDV